MHALHTGWMITKVNNIWCLTIQKTFVQLSIYKPLKNKPPKTRYETIRAWYKYFRIQYKKYTPNSVLKLKRHEKYP